MKRVLFYRAGSGRCPVQEFLDTLSDRDVAKVAWVLKLLRDLDVVPIKFFKKLVNTEGICEIRVDIGRNAFRLLGFCEGRDLIILTNSFRKKTQKTPPGEIAAAEQRKRDYQARRNDNG